MCLSLQTAQWHSSLPETERLLSFSLQRFSNCSEIYGNSHMAVGLLNTQVCALYLLSVTFLRFCSVGMEVECSEWICSLCFPCAFKKAAQLSVLKAESQEEWFHTWLRIKQRPLRAFPQPLEPCTIACLQTDAIELWEGALWDINILSSWNMHVASNKTTESFKKNTNS